MFAEAVDFYHQPNNLAVLSMSERALWTHFDCNALPEGLTEVYITDIQITNSVSIDNLPRSLRIPSLEKNSLDAFGSHVFTLWEINGVVPST